MNSPPTLHTPVLKNEAIQYLNPRLGDLIVDATLGLGGHAESILQKIGPQGLLIGIDQDGESMKKAKERLKSFHNVLYVHDNFENLQEILEEIETMKPEKFPAKGILFDLGFSSLHIEDETRGFSFLKDGPLDMRLDQRQKITAEEIINLWPLKTLINIFKIYGEEPHGKLIAQAIIEQRKIAKITRTLELADLIARKVRGYSRIHPATRTFQALRIVVNHELDALEKGLTEAIQNIGVNGRIVVISFHSLEDRIVKNIFRNYARREEPPVLKILTKKIVVPSEEETFENPRARSAKLRAVERIM